MRELLIMKKLIPTIALFAIGLVVSSCESQVTAQNSQPTPQLSPMNIPIEPAPDPKDANRQLPSTARATLGFPPVANPAANIGERGAAEKALKIAANRYKASNSRVIKSSVMIYKEAMRLGPEPIEVSEDDPLVNTPVQVVEIAGDFKVRNRPRPWQGVPATTLAYTKGYIILRAADGLLLGSHLFK